MWIYETIDSYMETNQCKVVFQLPPQASMQHFQLWSLKAVICYCYLHGYDLLQVKIHDDLFLRTMQGINSDYIVAGTKSWP